MFILLQPVYKNSHKILFLYNSLKFNTLVRKFSSLKIINSKSAKCYELLRGPHLPLGELVQRYTLKMSSLNCLFLNTFSTFLITFRSVCKFLGKPNSQHSHNRKRLPNRRFDYSVSSVSLSKQHHFVIGV